MADADPAEMIRVPAGSRILGCIETSGDVIIFGTVDGEVRARRIEVRNGGTVLGMLVGKHVSVQGRAHDSIIFAEKVTLDAGSDVTGELYYRDLDIRADSYFEGKTRRHENPQALAPKVEAAGD